jgi:hypothetical protein
MALGFLSKLFKNVPVVGTGLEILGAGAKLLSKNKPQQMSQQLTPEQKILMAQRIRQLQNKANDPTGLNYVRKAGGIYDQSMGL